MTTQKNKDALEAMPSQMVPDSRIAGWFCAHEETIRTALQQDEWQPISSAPRDGTPLMLGFYCEDSLNWLCKGSYRTKGYSVQDWYDSGGERIRTPTHWRPLPPPPAE